MRLLPGQLALLGLSACILSACVPATLSPAFQTVSARYSAPVPQTARQMDAGWFASFRDPGLEALLAKAKRTSPDLRSAAAAVLKARALAGEDGGPSLTAAASAMRQGSDGTTTEVSATSLDASWEVDLFGKARQTRAAARASAAAEEMAYAGAFTSLAAEIADDYVQYRACRQIETIYRAAAGSQDETLGATKALVGSGLAPKSDAALAEAYAASARMQATTAHADCRILAQTLAVAVGVPQDEVDAILAKGTRLPAPQGFAVKLPADALRQRPDVVEAELRLAAASATFGAAQADFFPQLTLSGDLTGGSSKGFAFGPGLSLPIFDGGARRATAGAAKADAMSAAESYRATVLAAVAEIDGALTRLSAARSNAAEATRAVQGYEAHFTAIDDNWKLGGESLLDREEARRSLQSARITEITEAEAVTRQWIALYKAAGGGWQPKGTR
jgi:NodT family efflux transporter outer membrane factor (OMF) lipoprotein